MNNYSASEDLPLILGTTNVYPKENNIGVRYGLSGTKINDEEILIFGGKGNLENYSGSTFNLNIVQKYNFSSNMWKYCSGKRIILYGSDNPFPKSYGYQYDDENLIGGRINHKIWKFSDHEILVFGGEGFDSTSSAIIK